jgi:hypothetical protein
MPGGANVGFSCSVRSGRAIQIFSLPDEPGGGGAPRCPTILRVTPCLLFEGRFLPGDPSSDLLQFNGPVVHSYGIPWLPSLSALPVPMIALIPVDWSSRFLPERRLP